MRPNRAGLCRRRPGPGQSCGAASRHVRFRTAREKPGQISSVRWFVGSRCDLLLPLLSGFLEVTTRFRAVPLCEEHPAQVGVALRDQLEPVRHSGIAAARVSTMSRFRRKAIPLRRVCRPPSVTYRVLGESRQRPLVATDRASIRRPSSFDNDAGRRHLSLKSSRGLDEGDALGYEDVANPSRYSGESGNCSESGPAIVRACSKASSASVCLPFWIKVLASDVLTSARAFYKEVRPERPTLNP